MEVDSDVLSMGFLLMTTAACVLRRRTINKRKRGYGVRPINLGLFESLIKAMINYDQEYFFKYTRMTPEMFNNLLSLVRAKLERNVTTKTPISPPQRLIITLHYLAEGCSQQEIASGYRIGKATVSKIIQETTEVIYKTLQPVVMPVPTSDDWTKVAEGFWKRWNIPNCVGPVDGKHVAIKCPPQSASQYYNYKKHFSLVLMAACDAFYRFIVVNVGGQGSNPDGNIGLPEDRILPNSDIKLPHFMVADAAFPLHKNIMRPYPGNFSGLEKNIFNYRLSRARRVIEHTFGILTQRWGIYFRPINTLLNTCENIILCTVVLHNYVQKCEEDIPLNQRKYCPTGFVDNEKDGMMTEGRWRSSEKKLRKIQRVRTNNSKRLAQDNRDLLKDFFLSPAGSVPWQMDYVLRGSASDNFV